ncbi:MAG: DUF481 domain-containing protein [Candidatus Latescibacterota bacterium]|nr:MAG: DUF481 domain-containing protein [Candidatus Latescibacterota bacterium]
MRKQPFRRLLVWCGMLSAFSAAGALAQEPLWQPPTPNAQAKDWVRLNSGEWLRGEIKRLRSEILEFDSQELDLLMLDMDDVAEIRSPHQYTYVFQGRITALGTATMRDSVLVVGTATGAVQFARSTLLSIIPGGTREIDFWYGTGHLSFVVHSGNTNQSDFRTVVRINRGGPVARLQLGYDGNFGRVNGKENLNNHSGSLKLDAFISNRFYLTPIAMDIFSDVFTNIDLRLSPSMGVGVTAIENRTVTWDIEFGAGYQWTKFSSVEEGEDSESSQASIIPASRLEWDFTPNIELRVEYELRIGIPDVRDTFHHLMAITSYDVTDDWNVEVAFTWDHVGKPRADAEGNVPKQDDFRMSFGIGVEF